MCEYFLDCISTNVEIQSECYQFTYYLDAVNIAAPKMLD